MNQATYCKIEAPKSRCPGCNNGLVLLQDIEIRRTKPMFYICFDCEKIFQVGKDEVLGAIDYTTREHVAGGFK